MSDPTPETTAYWAITGRFLGDDEDTYYVTTNRCTLGDATTLFVEAVVEPPGTEVVVGGAVLDVHAARPRARKSIPTPGLQVRACEISVT